MVDLAHLALKTDSTRFVTLSISGTNLVPPILGVQTDWHNLSHHGKDPEKLKQLTVIESEEMRLLSQFLNQLEQTQLEDETLLDRTMVLFGSNLDSEQPRHAKPADYACRRGTAPPWPYRVRLCEASAVVQCLSYNAATTRLAG